MIPTKTPNQLRILPISEFSINYELHNNRIPSFCCWHQTLNILWMLPSSFLRIVLCHKDSCCRVLTEKWTTSEISGNVVLPRWAIVFSTTKDRMNQRVSSLLHYSWRIPHFLGSSCWCISFRFVCTRFHEIQIVKIFCFACTSHITLSWAYM